MIFHQFIIIPTHPILWCTISFMLGIAYGGSSVASLPTIASSQNGSLSPIALATLALCSVTALPLLFFLISRLLQPFLFTSSTIFFRLCRLILIAALLTMSFCFGNIRRCTYIQSYQSLVSLITAKPFDAIAQVLSIERIRSRPFSTRMSVRLLKLVRGDLQTQPTPLTRSESGSTMPSHLYGVPLHTKIQLSLIKKPSVKIGDTILIKGLTLKPPTQETYYLYLFKEGYSATAFIPYLSYKLIESPYWCFTRYRASVQKRLIHGFTKKFSPQTSTLFYPLFLGIPSPRSGSSDIRKLHANWGIVHYLARSGLHVILLAASWSYLLRCIPINFFLKQFILLILVLLYHVLTFPSISFLRALITYILYKLCIMQNLSYQPLHILSLTTLGVLIANPLQLFFLDFQLSFGLTFALAWFNEVRMRKQRLPLLSL